MVPPNILLTGGTGFLGTHILRQLLSHPSHPTVHLTLRAASKISHVKSDFPQDLSRLFFSIVPDITSPDAFHSVVDESFTAVVHAASPFLYSTATSNEDFLDPAVKGTTELLRAVKGKGVNVKRVVLTSSWAAVGDLGHVERMGGRVLSEADWNPVSWEEALEGDRNAAYQGSKKFAEEAAWTFMREESPSFDLVTICPPMIYGPLEHSIQSPAELNQSNLRIYENFVNSRKDADVPPNGLYLYADPREVAAAHIAAIFSTRPEASNQRFIISGGQLSSQFISDTLRANFPELEERTPVGKPGTSSLPRNPYDTTSAKAERILAIKNRPVEATLVDLGRQLLDIEARAKAGLE